jgi:glycosyltransferase involved in cell wall biosynthesis
MLRGPKGVKAIRILYSSHTYPPLLLNGQSIFTQNLAEGMAARGHEILVLVPRTGDVDYREHQKGVQLLQIPNLHAAWFHPDLYVSLLRQAEIDRIFERFQPQLLHLQDISPLSQALNIKARKVGVPVVATHHPGPEATGPYLRRTPLVLKKLLSRMAWKMIARHLNRADVVTVPSQYSVRMLTQHGVKTHIQRLACGIQLDLFMPKPGLDRGAGRDRYGLDEDKVLLLYVGRIDIEKNLETLIAGMARVENQAIQLAIAGQGAEEKWIRRLVKKLGLGARVAFLGRVQQDGLPDLVNAADLFVMPGSGESFSIATLEAMACAKPILAANGAALPELVTHLENGYLFTPDDPGDVKQGIEQLIQRRGEWEAMGESSRRKAQEFGLDHFLNSTERIYQSF